MRKFVRGACAAALLWISAGVPVVAAPDGTLGTALLFAVVGSDGTLFRGSGVASVTPDGVGLYSVIFDRDVTGCAYMGAAGIPGSQSSSGGAGYSIGIVHTASLGGVPAGVFVSTFDPGGTSAPKSFHLTVFCAE